MESIVSADIGTVRIGVAASDPSGSFAQALCVLQASGSWMDELVEIVRERRASILLIGMPRRTDGTDGPEAAAMRKKISKLKTMLDGVEVREWDERFTTTIAQRALLEADVSRSGRKERVDKVAAAVLLQSYLDSRRALSDQMIPDMMPAPDRSRAGRRSKMHAKTKERY